ncbi:RNA-binding protein [Candidatus Pacearchaeota archaeon]|nr:RNA-binding protein [Candidatus Pacearchaeota archaeon]
MKCLSCGLEGKGIIFHCQSCNKKLARCQNCRKLSIKYKCECGAEGP